MSIRTYCMLIDIKRDVFEIIRLKPVDTGNVIHIRFSEDGKPLDLTGQSVKFMAKKADGTGVYNFANIIDTKAGEVEVSITNQMTAIDGELECEIEIEGSELITTMTFYITIDKKLNDGGFIESTNEFTVLQKAIREAYEAIDVMEDKTDTKLAQLQNQVNSAISDMNDTTDNKLSSVQQQVNNSISDMNNTTDNKLSQLQLQVNNAIDSMNDTTDDKLLDLQQQVTVSISDMNNKTDNKLLDIQRQFDAFETELTGVVNDKIIEVDNTQNALVTNVNSKMSELTQKVNDKIAEHTNTINSKVTDVNNKLKVVDNKITEINSTVSNANNAVDKLEQDVATAILGIDNKIDSKLVNKADKTHNHDSVYLGKTAKAESSKTADSVAWGNVSGKPSSYTPSTHNHDSSYLKLSGGSMSGKITTNVVTNSYLAGNRGEAIINSSTSAGAYVMLYRYPSSNGYFTMGGYHGNLLLQYTAKSTVDAGTNSVTKSLTLLNESGNSSFPGTVTAQTFSGSLSGNASTASILQTSRTINGTSFNGSGNITTANWGTTRSITIGNTSKNVNGSGNVSWSLAEIGADSAATANKLALRDNSGDLSVRLVRASYANQSNISGALAFRVNNSSDNYIRFCSDTGAIRNWLGVAPSSHSHNYAGSSSAGGNANAALKLVTARTINGTNFDGTGNITTANWGTARTLTIGKSGKSVNGSGNVSWSLGEIGCVEFDHSGDTSGNDHPRIFVGGKEWLRAPSGGFVPYAHGKGYLGLSNKAWYDFHTLHINSKPCQGTAGRWWNCMLDVGTNGVTEIGRFIDFHDTDTTTADYTVRLTNTGSTLNCSGTFTQGSDRKLKEDIEYLKDSTVYNNTKELVLTPFRDFLKNDFKACTYRYKGTSEKVLGFIAQDVVGTPVGELFTRKLTNPIINKSGDVGVEGEETNLVFDLSGYTTIIAIALQEEINKRDIEIQELKNRLSAIESKLGIV